TLLLLSQTAITAYSLHLSYQNITRLQQYEEKSEKAAEWSNTAAERLRKTRTTQTGATVAVCLRISCSATILMIHLLSNSPPILPPPALALLNAAATALSRQHMANFWNDRNQTQVPFMTQFNEAIKGSETVVGMLSVSAVVWGVIGVV
ncbi:hypothetical protein BS50DRAFT_450499, partial [Corynespora cassiicola Philippines]